MRTKLSAKIFGALFIAASLVNLTSLWFGNQLAANCAKPFLMPLLALTAYFYLSSFSLGKSGKTLTLMAALAFGTIGDILLMFNGESFFLAGMAAFFIGHMFYGCTLWRNEGPTPWNIFVSVFAALLIVGISVLFQSFDISGTMSFCARTYSIVFPLLIASSLYGVPKSKWYLLTAAGFALFAFSDYLIAVKVFGGTDFPHRGFCVMATYITAQAVVAASIAKAGTLLWKKRTAGESRVQ